MNEWLSAKWTLDKEPFLGSSSVLLLYFYAAALHKSRGTFFPAHNVICEMNGQLEMRSAEE